MDLLFSDVFLEAARSLVAVLLVAFLAVRSVRRGQHKVKGWRLVMAGFGLLAVGSIVDVTDNYPELGRYVVLGDTPYQAVVEKVIGYLLGSILLLAGFASWLPMVERFQKDEAERAARRHIEKAERETEARRHELLRLQERNEYQTRFINAAAHEINTPMTPLILEVSLLKGRIAESGDASLIADVAAIERSVGRLLDVSKALLTSARSGGPFALLTTGPVSPRSLVENVAQKYAVAAKDAGVVLRAEALSDGLVSADAGQASRAIGDLVANAIRFSRQGGEVSVLASDGPQGVAFEVRDDGVGLTREQIAQLFEPFGKVHRDGEGFRRQGSGLGLYAAKAIAEQHGGTLTAASPGPGLGAVFTLTIPRSPTSG